MRLNRLAVLATTGVIAIGGTTAWAISGRADANRQPCADVVDPRAPQRPPAPLTDEERRQAARIALADPIVLGLLGGYVPTQSMSSNSGSAPGYRVPAKFVIDRGPLGRTAAVWITLPVPLPAGRYRWRVFEAQYRNGCPSDGAEWMTRVVEGDAAGSGGSGSPQLTARRLNIEVSLRAQRTLMVMGESYVAENYAPVGNPEYLFPGR